MNKACTSVSWNKAAESTGPVSRSGFMKTTTYLLMVLMAGMLALAGCGKPKQPPPPPVPPVADVGKLFEAFPSPSAEVQGSLGKVRFAVRYRQLDVALVELDKLAQIPDLTDAQKKAVSDKIEQVKRAIDEVLAKPPQ
jgi:hypothetical protein